VGRQTREEKGKEVFEFIQEVYLGVRTFLAGMRVTGTYFVNANLRPKETITTVAYDGSVSLAAGVKVAERFRGHLQLDTANCIGCKTCVKTCPIDCIWVDTEKSETGKLHVSRFDVDQLKCMYCGQCVRVCPTGGLTMSKRWWGATFHTDDGTNLHGQLRSFGAGYYTPEQKLENERKRQEAAEAKKKAAAMAAKPTPPPPSPVAAVEKKAETPTQATAPSSAVAAPEKKPDTPAA